MPSTGETLIVPHDMIPRGHNYVLRVTGDGMEEESIRDGDFLIINPRTDAGPDALVVVEVVGVEGQSVCRLSRHEEHAFLHKGNEVQCKPSEDVRVCGVVVGVIRKY